MTRTLIVALVFVSLFLAPPAGATALQPISFLLSGITDPNTGLPASAGLVYFYAPGTTTAKAVYADPGATTAASNPTVLDAAGTALVYATGSYKIVITNSEGTTIESYAALNFYGGDSLLIISPLTVEDAADATKVSKIVTDQVGTNTSYFYSIDTDAPTVMLPMFFGGDATAKAANYGLYIDTTNHRVGVNNTAPAYTLDVTGTINSSSSISATAAISSSATVSGLKVDAGASGIESDGDLVFLTGSKNIYTDASASIAAFYSRSNSGTTRVGDSGYGAVISLNGMYTGSEKGLVSISADATSSDAASGRIAFSNTSAGRMGFFNKDGGLNIGTSSTDSASSTYKLYVNGATYLGGALTAASFGDINATTLDVTGRSRLRGASDFNGAVRMDSTLGVTGAVTLLSTLDVTDQAVLRNGVYAYKGPGLSGVHSEKGFTSGEGGVQQSKIMLGKADGSVGGLGHVYAKDPDIAYNVATLDDLRIGSYTANEAIYWDTSELRVGINDDTPAAALDVNGDGTESPFQVQDSGTTAFLVNGTGRSTFGASDLAGTSAKVYIDAVAEGAGLTVSGPVSSTQANLRLLAEIGLNGWAAGDLVLQGYDSAGAAANYAEMNARIKSNKGPSGVSGSLELATSYDGTMRNGFILNDSSNVTIGASDLATTAYKLYVNGAARVNGAFSCTDFGVTGAPPYLSLYNTATTGYGQLTYNTFIGAGPAVPKLSLNFGHNDVAGTTSIWLLNSVATTHPLILNHTGGLTLKNSFGVDDIAGRLGMQLYVEGASRFNGATTTSGQATFSSTGTFYDDLAVNKATTPRITFVRGAYSAMAGVDDALTILTDAAAGDFCFRPTALTGVTRWGNGSATTTMLLNNSGNLTIGASDLASTTYKLYSDGTAYFNGNTHVQGQLDTTDYIKVNRAGDWSINLGSRQYWSDNATYNGNILVSVGGTASAICATTQQENNTADMRFGARTSDTDKALYWDTSESRLGINDDSPSYGLDVNGTFRSTGAATFDSTVISKGAFTAGLAVPAANTMYCDGSAGTHFPRALVYTNKAETTPFSDNALAIHNENTTDNNWSELLFSTFEGNGGNNVAGAAIAAQFRYRSIGSWVDGDLSFYTNQNSGLERRMTINSVGNTTLGATDLASTTSKFYSLSTGAGVPAVHAVNSYASGNGECLRLSNTGDTSVGAHAGNIWFSGLNSAGALANYAVIHATKSDNTAGSTDGKLEFYTNYNNNLTKAFIINDSQGVTIGATDLAGTLNKLWVNGAMQVGATNTVMEAIAGAQSGRIGLESTNGGALIHLGDNQAVAADKGPGGVYFSGRSNDTGPAFLPWAAVTGLKANATQGNGDGYMKFMVSKDGVGLREAVRITADAMLQFAVQPSAATDVALHINSSTGLVTKASSSIRYKENVRPTDIDWKTFMKVRPCMFDWKNKSSKNQLGLIADELIKLYPGVCQVDAKGRPEAIDYGRYAANVHTSAIQDLKKDDAKDDARIAKLEAENDELKARLAKLEKMVEKMSKGVK